MNAFVLKGNLCYSESADRIRLIPNGYLVCEEGVCLGAFETLPERFAALPLKDFGDRLILPGLVDLHLHAPQFAFRGLGMDMELLDWLNTYTFPEESKYADLRYAERAYSQFADHLHRSATTRAAVFATIHAPATELLMEKLEQSGLVSYVGKVNMDRNSPDYLCEKDAAASIAATEEWICRTRDRFAHTKPILTPRFIPSCTDALMRGLRSLVEKYDLPVQSHLSENFGEIAWVQELCPSSAFYGDAYDRFGLFGGDHKCIMAHCVQCESPLRCRAGDEILGAGTACCAGVRCGGRRDGKPLCLRRCGDPFVQAALAAAGSVGQGALRRSGVLYRDARRRRILRQGRQL